MIPLRVELIERGPTPRHLRTSLTRAKKKGFFDGGVFFHAVMSDNRFSHSHARQAGYAPRKKRYTAAKVRKYGHSRPLERTGRARRLSRTARITSTSKGARIFYPGLRGLNRRHPNSNVDMVEEWTTVLPSETQLVAQKIDNTIDNDLNQDTKVTRTAIG